jgi:hypothetical protein
MYLWKQIWSKDVGSCTRLHLRRMRWQCGRCMQVGDKHGLSEPCDIPQLWTGQQPGVSYKCDDGHRLYSRHSVWSKCEGKLRAVPSHCAPPDLPLAQSVKIWGLAILNGINLCSSWQFLICEVNQKARMTNQRVNLLCSPLPVCPSLSMP